MEGSGLVQMLKQDKYLDIKLMYSLFKRCPLALEVFKTELKSYIISEGQKLVRNDELETEDLVKHLIKFREHMNDLLN